MATFSAFAQVDLRSDADPERFLDALVDVVTTDERLARYASEPLYAWIREADGLARVGLLAWYGDTWLADGLVRTAELTGVVERTIIGLDHDEYGIEHIVLSGRAGGLCRVQHVYLALCGECEPSLSGVPACEGLEVKAPRRRLLPLRTRDWRLIDGPLSWVAVAELFGVPLERILDARRLSKRAHRELGLIFTPFQPWWDAVDSVYPGELGSPDAVLIHEESD